MAYDDDPAYVLAAGAAFPAICIMAVSLRFYTRGVQKAAYGLDDLLALLALFMVIGCGVCLIVGVKLKALGYPTPLAGSNDNPNYQTPTNAKIEYVFFIIQPLALGFTKLSFVFLYRRIFLAGTPSTVFGIATLVTIGVITAWMVSFFFAYIFVCGSHFSALWDSFQAARVQCFKTSVDRVSFATTDFVTDAIVLLLPIPMVLRLHMTTSRKFAILAVFGLGAVAMVASILRLAIFVGAFKVSGKGIVDTDLLITRGLYWSMLEAGLALVACCLPSLRALMGSSLQSAIQSVRSAISLRSSGSGRLNDSKGSNALNSHAPQRNESTASDIAMVRKNSERPANTVEAYSLDDGPSLSHEDHDATHGGIWVDRSFESSSNMV